MPELNEAIFYLFYQQSHVLILQFIFMFEKESVLAF